MPTRTYRQRIRPQFKRGLRVGKERDTMTEWLERHPEIAERLRRTIQRLDAMGVGRADMRRVKQPFDYDYAETSSRRDDVRGCWCTR